MNNLKCNKEDGLEEIEKLVKPKISVIVIATLVCLGPYGNLILQILNKDYSKLLLTALLVFPTLILMSIYWCWYVYSLRTYKKVANDVFAQLNKD